MLKVPSGGSDNNNYANVMFLIYLDSASPDWIEILQSYHIPILISPLHDKDTFYKSDPFRFGAPVGTYKKPHYHVLCSVKGGKSKEFWQALADSVGAANGYIEVINCVGSMVRYLVHADDPDKHQYNAFDICSMGGFQYGKYFDIEDDSVLDKTFDLMCAVINDRTILCYKDFVDYCRSEEPSWSRCLRRGLNTMVKDYIKSFAFMVTGQGKKTVLMSDFTNLQSKYDKALREINDLVDKKSDLIRRAKEDGLDLLSKYPNFLE